MAIAEIKSGDKYNRMPKEFWMDDDSEKDSLPIDAPTFSLAISKQGSVFVLGSDKIWVKFGGEG